MKELLILLKRNDSSAALLVVHVIYEPIGNNGYEYPHIYVEELKKRRKDTNNLFPTDNRMYDRIGTSILRKNLSGKITEDKLTIEENGNCIDLKNFTQINRDILDKESSSIISKIISENRESFNIGKNGTIQDQLYHKYFRRKL
ncbi:hypothetical protein D0T51_09010 [Parabacteroides sp. 52]|uniref:hypothetical protein n=1 Tax=unclassified Parabacteroides TaxID=2649774 RepID=UPI0013D7596A|nr:MULTISPECIES: hypothetical protein [unclassified Parabacteroides]MDH6535299.1 hypothetical protein [Parabacteroides sp. PM5-20]NDV55862.1 hypothetical protein [Parabacteroides sp. 52]